jgi:predicted transposase YdaD
MSVTTESAAYEIIKKEGFDEGFEKGVKMGIEQWFEEAREEGWKNGGMEIIRNFISLGILTDEQIASATRLSVEQVRELKQSLDRDA